jgi:hypothetical protein
MTEHEAWRHLRRPLPRWWWSYRGGGAVRWPELGIGFEARRGEPPDDVIWRCFVARRTLERICRAQLTEREMLRCWAEHGPRFEVGARRKIEALRMPAARLVVVELADLEWD